MSSPKDAFGLQRFVDAQQPVYEQALAELRRGRKQSHWMWFIFPQIAGLGGSAMARRYAIGSLAEARAYLDHALLGPRLDECTRALLAHRGARAEAILGGIDAMKLRSSMTLFGQAAGPDSRFDACIAAFFGGERDPKTLDLLGPGRSGRSP